MAGRTYAENRPYLLPETLRELAGPVTGVVRLPLRLDWSERTEVHLDDLAERNVMYERVIREETRVDDLRSYLNEQVLRQVWGRLFLPARVRRSWEDRFPDLRLAAQTRDRSLAWIHFTSGSSTSPGSGLIVRFRAGRRVCG